MSRRIHPERSLTWFVEDAPIQTSVDFSSMTPPTRGILKGTGEIGAAGFGDCEMADPAYGVWPDLMP